MAWHNLEISVLMRTFAQAFDVEPPKTTTLPAFREFTATCMEAALADEVAAARYRARLGEEARKLGARVAAMPGVRALGPSRVTRLLYRGIGIDLHGDLPGALRFGPCFFSWRYTPEVCQFMAAFDEGFMRGISGCDEASLTFRCRLTEGAPCCLARFDIDIEEGNAHG